MGYLEKWIKYLTSQPSLILEHEIQVQGVCKEHLGARLEYAIIELKVEPSNILDVVLSNNLKYLDKDSKDLLDIAIFGILDIIMTAKSIPLKNIKIKFLNVDIHPIDSNRSAFLKAGRDAGRKIIKAIK